MVSAWQCCDDSTLHPPQRLGEHWRAGDRPRLGLDSLQLRRRARRAPPQLVRQVTLPLMKHTDGKVMRVADHLDHLGRALDRHHDHGGVKRGLADPVGGYAVLIALALHGQRIQAVGKMSEDRLFRGAVHGEEYGSAGAEHATCGVAWLTHIWPTMPL